MKLRIMLAAGVCALAALGAGAGSASAAVPYGNWTMTANALPGGTSVTFEMPFDRVTCQGSNVLGTHQAPAPRVQPWTVSSMNFNYCVAPKFAAKVEVPVTVPVLPSMTVISSPNLTRVGLYQFKPKMTILGCELEFEGSMTAEAPGPNPLTSESFTATKDPLSVVKASSWCSNLYIGVGDKASVAVNYGSTPIG